MRAVSSGRLVHDTSRAMGDFYQIAIIIRFHNLAQRPVDELEADYRGHGRGPAHRGHPRVT